MKYVEAVEILKEFWKSENVIKYFGNIEVKEFGDDQPIIAEKNVYLPKDGIGHQSGIYFIYSISGEIYYIGKATKDNLHEEVWGKITTPQPRDGLKTNYYPKNYFLNRKTLEEGARNDVTNGNVKISVLTISNKELSSLAEVYLQTIFLERLGKLPKLNSRIG